MDGWGDLKWHLIFSAIGTRVLQRTTTLLDSVKDIDMPVSHPPAFHLLFALSQKDLSERTNDLPAYCRVFVRGGSCLQREKWMKSILPIGVLFSGSLILSNYAYLT